MVASAEQPAGLIAHVPMPHKERGKLGGNPSKYSVEYLKDVEVLARHGATTREIAQFLGVTEQTFYNWLHAHPELVIAHKLGKEMSDDRVVRSLYNRAVGYSFDSEKVFQFQGNEVRVPTVEHIPPDTNAALFWLKNRRPKEWRDRTEVDQTVTHTLSDSVSALINNVRQARAETTIEAEVLPEIQQLPASQPLPASDGSGAGGF